MGLQSSVKSDANRKIITFNVGVSSERLLQFLSRPPVRTKLVINDCHWCERLGFLIPDRHDKWWQVGPETDLEQLGAELVDCLENYAIPALEKYATDEALRDLWLSGESPGLTNEGRLSNLALLLSALGPAECLEPVLAELKQLAEKRRNRYWFDRLVRQLQGSQVEAEPPGD